MSVLMHVSFFASGIFPNFLTSVVICLLALCLAFFWYQWKMVRAFKHFPSKRLDTALAFRILMWGFPTDVPVTCFFFQEVLKAASSFREEGIGVLWFLKPFVVVYNEEILKNLLYEVDLLDTGSFYERNRLIFGNGLLASMHEEWKTQRKLLSPAFSLAVLKSKMNSLNKYASRLVDRLEAQVDKPSVDVWNALKHCAFQNMADFVLGLKFEEEKHTEIVERFMRVVDEASKQSIENLGTPWLRWDILLPLFKSGKKYLKIANEVNLSMQEIINELKNKEISEKEQKVDISENASSCADIIMKLKRESEFTEHDVRDQLVNFVSAGYETVSVTMLWCIYMLGHYPEVQEKTYSEIKSTVPEGDITYDDLAELKYLDCVIKEIMRLYTTVPIMGRQARQGIKCGKYTIPKGTEVAFIPFLLHRDQNIYPEPEKFNPDRFWDNSKIRPWMYIPFGEGYRNCIGKKYAMLEIKIHLVHILRRYRIKSMDKIQDKDLDWTITLKPTKHLRFSFENRISKV